MNNRITNKDIRHQLAEAVTQYLDQFESQRPGKGWYTLVKLGEKLGVGERQAGNIAKRFINVKHCETRNFRVKVGQYIRPVKHYKFSKGASKALGL